MKRIVLLIGVLFMFVSPVLAQDDDYQKDVTLMKLLCATNNANEVAMWFWAVDGEIDRAIDYTYDYGSHIYQATFDPRAKAPEYRIQYIRQHALVWWFYGFMLDRYPQHLDYAINYYNYQRLQIYLWMEDYQIDRVVCDVTWNPDYLGIDDPRGGVVSGLPDYSDWQGERNG